MPFIVLLFFVDKTLVFTIWLDLSTLIFVPPLFPGTIYSLINFSSSIPLHLWAILRYGQGCTVHKYIHPDIHTF